MSAPKIKNVIHRKERELTRQMRHGHIPTVSIAFKAGTNEVLVVGKDGSAAVRELEKLGLADAGTWEIREMKVSV